MLKNTVRSSYIKRCEMKGLMGIPKDVMVMWDINNGYIKPLLEKKDGEKDEGEDYGF